MESSSTESKRVSGSMRWLIIALDRLIYVISRRWLVFANTLIFIYVGLPFAAPVFMHLGYSAPAHLIYNIYAPLCHQLGYRSWFLFGERIAYPRDIFRDYTGIDPDSLEMDDLLAARAFVGNERMGYKVAYCQRDIAIYGAILLGGLIYSIPAIRRRIKPLPWVVWLVLGIGPIAFDGIWQLLATPPYHTLPLLNRLPAHESTPLLRIITGALFGLTNVWLAYPYLDESFREFAQTAAAKLAPVDAEKTPITN